MNGAPGKKARILFVIALWLFLAPELAVTWAALTDPGLAPGIAGGLAAVTALMLVVAWWISREVSRG